MLLLETSVTQKLLLLLMVKIEMATKINMQQCHIRPYVLKGAICKT